MLSLSLADADEKSICNETIRSHPETHCGCCRSDHGLFLRQLGGGADYGLRRGSHVDKA